MRIIKVIKNLHERFDRVDLRFIRFYVSFVLVHFFSVVGKLFDAPCFLVQILQIEMYKHYDTTRLKF